jgi:hypothetical protein
MRISHLRTNRKKEIEGVWVDIGDGGSLLIARANNLHYLAKYRVMTKPYWSQIRSAEMPIEKHVEIIQRCTAETVLLNWKGITDIDADGKEVEVPYTTETAFEYLRDISDFRDLVQTISDQQFRFREEEVAAAVGNSSAP